jgi:hypothetical protein
MAQVINESYFYNATIRKTVAVFGSIFNNIYTGKEIGGNLTNIARVPLAYGPREHFLVRIRTQDNSANADIAIKLPRMSFEITSLSYDTTAKLNRLNSASYPVDGNNGANRVVKQASPYILGMSLSIMSRDLDSAQQILEQILPTFNPDYTVTVKVMEGPDSKTDVPIVLNGVTMQDEYEGDFETSRRTIIYTLDFTIKIKFVSSTNTLRNIIKSITVNLHNGSPCDDNSEPIDRVNLELGDPLNDTPEEYTVITTYGFD